MPCRCGRRNALELDVAQLGDVLGQGRRELRSKGLEIRAALVDRAGPDEADADRRASGELRIGVGREAERVGREHGGPRGGRAACRARCASARRRRSGRRSARRRARCRSSGGGGTRTRSRRRSCHRRPAAPRRGPDARQPMRGRPGRPRSRACRPRRCRGEAELARKPAHAAAEREPADARVRDVARGRGEPMRIRGPIEVAQQRAALDERPLRGGSTRTALIGVRSSISPPSGTDRPMTLWPPHFTAISRPRSRPWRIAATTSSAEVQRAITAGRRSTAAFHTSRCSSYRSSPGSTTSPAKRGIVRTSVTGTTFPLRGATRAHHSPECADRAAAVSRQRQ